jgi:hypothetical protein
VDPEPNTIYILERAIKVINYSRQIQALKRFNQINLDSNRLGAKSLKYKLMTFYFTLRWAHTEATRSFKIYSRFCCWVQRRCSRGPQWAAYTFYMQ